VISRRVGGAFTAPGGHLRGQSLAIVPGGGRIAMTHVNVPDANAASITRGWSEYYWKPFRTYLKRARKGDRR
jgi:hypothetical protein